MPDRAPKPCRSAGCKELTNKAYCKKHNKYSREHGLHHQGSANDRGYDARWQRYRAVYLAEHQMCSLRLDSGCTLVADCIDHIKPHEGNRAVFWDTDNHQPSCIHCNSVKGKRIIKGKYFQKIEIATRQERNSTALFLITYGESRGE